MRLKTARMKRNLSQAALGKQLKPAVTQTLVSQWEIGTTLITLPHANQIVAMFPGEVSHADLEAMYRGSAHRGA